VCIFARMKTPILTRSYPVLVGLLALLLAACGGKPDAASVKNTFADGSTSEEYSLNADSLRHGSYTSYHANGKVFEKLSYRNGLLWEVLEIRDADGQLLAEKTLKDGTGSLPRYTTTGQLIARAAYRNGLPDGPLELFEPSSASTQPIYELKYLNGLPVSNDHPLYLRALAQAPVDTSGNEVLPAGGKAIPGFSTQFPNRVMRLLLARNLDSLYALTPALYKQRYKLDDLKLYLDFAHELLGPYTSYKLASYDSETVPGQGTAIQVRYKTRHLNAEGITELLLIMKDSATIELGNIAIQTIPGNPIPGMDKVGNPIMQLLQDKKPDQVYDMAGQELKKMVNKNQFVQMFNQLYQMGGITRYSLQHTEVSLMDGKAVVVLLYKITVGTQDIGMQLAFSRSKDGTYTLELINA
jgi:hypothetical protein